MPLLPVVFHSGARFLLQNDVVENAAYRAHRRRMDALGSFEQVLEELERICKRLERAAKVDRSESAGENQDRRRSRAKSGVLFRRLCVARDLHFRAPYAVRFLNTVARYNASSPPWRALATRAIGVVDDLLFRSDWRGRGNRPQQREAPSPEQIEAERKALTERIKAIWRDSRDDMIQRKNALKQLLHERGLTNVGVPSSVLRRPPSRAIEFILSQHFGVSEVATRPRSQRVCDLLYG